MRPGILNGYINRIRTANRFPIDSDISRSIVGYHAWPEPSTNRLVRVRRGGETVKGHKQKRMCCLAMLGGDLAHIPWIALSREGRQGLSSIREVQ